MYNYIFERIIELIFSHRIINTSHHIELFNPHRIKDSSEDHCLIKILTKISLL